MEPIRVPTADYMARLHWRIRARRPMWIVYRPVTREYPGKWVTRMHVTLPEAKVTRFVITHDTLAELRTLLPWGLVRLTRDPQDLPEIEEVWV